MLDDLGERGWIEPSDPGYRATPLGEAVVEEVLALHSKLATLRKLQGLERWFPGQEDLDVSSFSGAEMVLPNRTTPLKPVNELCRVVSERETIRAVPSCPPGFTHLLARRASIRCPPRRSGTPRGPRGPNGSSSQSIL